MNAKDFKKVLARAKKYVDSKGSTPEIKIGRGKIQTCISNEEGDQVNMYQFRNSMFDSIETPILVNFDNFNKIICKIKKTNDLEFSYVLVDEETDEIELIIKAGSFEFKISGLEDFFEDKFPEVPDGFDDCGTLELDQKAIDLIQKSRIHLAKPNSAGAMHTSGRFKYTLLHDSGRVVGCDLSQMGFYNTSAVIKSFRSVLLDPTLITKPARVERVPVSDDRDLVRVTMRDERLYLNVPGAEAFPNWARFDPDHIETFDADFMVCPAELLEAIEGALSVANTASYKGTINVLNGAVTIQTEDIDFKSSFKADLSSADLSLKDNMRMAFNLSKMLTILKNEKYKDDVHIRTIKRGDSKVIYFNDEVLLCGMMTY